MQPISQSLLCRRVIHASCTIRDSGFTMSGRHFCNSVARGRSCPSGVSQLRFPPARFLPRTYLTRIVRTFAVPLLRPLHRKLPTLRAFFSPFILASVHLHTRIHLLALLRHYVTRIPPYVSGQVHGRRAQPRWLRSRVTFGELVLLFMNAFAGATDGHDGPGREIRVA